MTLSQQNGDRLSMPPKPHERSATRYQITVRVLRDNVAVRLPGAAITRVLSCQRCADVADRGGCVASASLAEGTMCVPGCSQSKGTGGQSRLTADDTIALP